MKVDKPFFAKSANMWVISRHCDITSILKDPDTYHTIQTGTSISDNLNLCPRAASAINNVIPLDTNRIHTSNGDYHSRFRKSVIGYFSENNLSEYLVDFKNLLTNIIELFQFNPELELVEHYTKPISLLSILMFLGVPEHDFNLIKKSHDESIRLYFGKLDITDQLQVVESLNILKQYMKDCLDGKIVLNNGLIKHIKNDLDTNSLEISHLEAIQFICDVISAAYDTTYNTLNWALYYLLLNSQIWNNVEYFDENQHEQCLLECLRLNLSQEGLIRFTVKDTDIDGVSIPQGSNLSLLQNLANRDPAIFKDPNSFQIGRENAGKILSFGFGKHYCLGTRMAKNTMKIAITSLRHKYPQLGMNNDNVQFARCGSRTTIKQLLVNQR